MEKILLFKHGDYEINRYNAIPEKAAKFLDQIAWGNSGTVYEHKNTAEHVRLLHQPALISAEHKGEMWCTVVFCNTPVQCGEHRYNCYYARYFAAAVQVRGNGMVPRLTVKVMQGIQENVSDKTIFYACVEKSNITSSKILQYAGYREIGLIKTQGFSRFFPRKQDLEPLQPDEREDMLMLLKEQYREHALVQFNSLFMHGQYFVMRESGRIVAGCQFHRVHWVVQSMRGRSGKMIVNLVPRIPLLRKLFNPKKFEFLAFEGIYVLPGYEKHLARLFEGLLAQENLHSALYWMAEKCPIRKRIQAGISAGLLHSFVKDADSNIMASFHRMSDDAISEVCSSPIYASAFDFI
jgi:hypothetical protein